MCMFSGYMHMQMKSNFALCLTLAVRLDRLLGGRQRLEMSNCRRRRLKLRGSRESCKH